MRVRPTAPDHITSELFAQFRSPRRGLNNPEVVTNPVWIWLIENNVWPYTASKIFGGPQSTEAGPGWCFDRFGRSETALPDGRIIKIAGEHEDHYDPDFYIYNDVVVRHSDGRIEIFAYPEEEFPPTDFHTATLVDGQIIIIGCLGYPQSRKAETQVLRLDTTSYRLERVRTAGVSPGWLYKHTAELVNGSPNILVRGGLIEDAAQPALIENIDDWQLNISDWTWTRLTNKQWPRFSLRRADGKQNHLYWLRSLLWTRDYGRPERFAADRAEMLRDLGGEPRLDLIPALYKPALAHVQLRKIEDEHRVHRISIDGTVVRYVEADFDIRLTVEGHLAPDIVEEVRSDLLGKLAVLENAEFECLQVSQP